MAGRLCIAVFFSAAGTGMRGLIADTLVRRHFGPHVNILAVLLDVIPKARRHAWKQFS
jgi:hypothetical protein